MTDAEYTRSEKITNIDPSTVRDIQWDSVDSFARYIQRHAPAGEIYDIHGIGYDCKEHEFDQQVLQLVVATRRPTAEVEREKAELERLRKQQAELAAIEAAKQAKQANEVRLRKRVEHLQIKIVENLRELDDHIQANADVLNIEQRGE